MSENVKRPTLAGEGRWRTSLRLASLSLSLAALETLISKMHAGHTEEQLVSMLGHNGDTRGLWGMSTSGKKPSSRCE